MRKAFGVAIGPALVGAGLVAAACVQEPVERAPRSVTVEMRGFGFQPARIEVAPGDTVVWINRDALPHTATSAAGAWDSGELDANARWHWVAQGSGTVEYLCTYHPTMRGTIVVE